MNRILNRMIGAEIDFIVRGINTEDSENKAAVASRTAAMLRLRRRFYINTTQDEKPLIYPGRVAEARIVSVGEKAIRVEVFGIETSINSRDLSWSYIVDARDDYFVGDVVKVKITNISGDKPESLNIRADVKSLSSDNTLEKLSSLKSGTNCMGTITCIRGGIMFISLIDGVRAVAHRCFDKRKPRKGDEVLFVVNRVDLERGNVLGLVSRIIKRNI